MWTYDLTMFLLQAGDDGGGQAPAAGGDAPPGGNPFDMFIILAIIMVIFWFLVFRPESKKRKERERKVAGLKKGDQVVTTGGILGKVWKVDERSVVLIVDKDKDLKLRVLKTSIYEVGSPEEDDASDAK